VLFANSRLVHPSQLADFAAFVLNRWQLLRVKKKLTDLDMALLEILSSIAERFINIDSVRVHWPPGLAKVPGRGGLFLEEICLSAVERPGARDRMGRPQEPSPSRLDTVSRHRFPIVGRCFSLAQRSIAFRPPTYYDLDSLA